MSNPLEDIALKDIPTILPLLSLPEQEKLLAELDHLEELKKRNLIQGNFYGLLRRCGLPS